MCHSPLISPERKQMVSSRLWQWWGKGWKSSSYCCLRICPAVNSGLSSPESRSRWLSNSSLEGRAPGGNQHWVWPPARSHLFRSGTLGRSPKACLLMAPVGSRTSKTEQLPHLQWQTYVFEPIREAKQLWLVWADLCSSLMLPAYPWDSTPTRALPAEWPGTGQPGEEALLVWAFIGPDQTLC